MKKLTITIFVLGFLLAGLIPVGQVLAHATPITYEPEASSIMENLPERITIHFSERIEPHASGITVLGPNGEPVHTGSAVIDPNDPHIYSVRLQKAGEGTFTVSWQVVSADDGHFTKGAFGFSVGKEIVATAPTEGQFQIVHSSALPEAMTIWVELLGQAILLGFLVLYAFLWRRFRKKYNFGASIAERRITIAILIAIVLILISAGSYLVLKTGELQGLQNLEFIDAFKTLLTTVTGSFTLYRFVLAFLFGAIFLASRRRIFGSLSVTKSEIALMILLLAMTYMRARVSHAAASHFLPGFSVFMNFVHLIGKNMWVGGLIVFASVFLPAMLKENRSLISSLSILFSKITSIAFGITAVSGSYIIWLHLKDPENAFTTEWGLRFIVLSFIAVIFLALRLYRQLIADRVGRTAWLPVAISVEAVVGIALLFVTSFLIITTPPLTYKNTFIKTTTSQGVAVSLEEHPFEERQILVSFSGPDGKAIPVEHAVITLTNQERSIGPIVAQTEQRSVGGFVFPKLTLSPVGIWQIDVTGQKRDGYDAVASFQTNFPKEIDASKPDPYKRGFGYFEILSLIGAVGAIGFAFLLYRYSERIYTSSVEGSKLIGAERPYYYSALASTAILLLVWMSYSYVFKSDFQKNCESNGHLWTQTVPQRFGRTTGQIAVTGCSLGVGAGQFHFASAEEYSYFLRPADANVKLVTTPEKIESGKPTLLTFAVKDSEGKPVSDLVIEHERLLHIIIVSEDFTMFSHLHVEDQGLNKEQLEKAQFPVEFTFPKAGNYLVSVDYAVRARHSSKQFVVQVGGAPKIGQAVADTALQKVFGDYTVQLNTDQLAVGKLIKLSYSIEKNGEPVTDLESYLGAPMHIVVVRSDFGEFSHTHGELPRPFMQRFIQGSAQHIHGASPNNFGPVINGYVSFPNTGLYHVFGEFKHDGKVIVTHFEINTQ